MNSIPRSLGLVLLLVRVVVQVSEGECLSPDAIVASDKQLFIACETGRQVLCLDLAGGQISKVSMPLPVSGLALSRDQSTLFVTCAGPESKICIMDTRWPRIVGTIRVGPTARAPVSSPDGGSLYVCD
jgi:DNA-binding beta-propeller fold protein YncE